MTRKGSLKRIVNTISGSKHEEEELMKSLCHEPFQESRMLLCKLVLEPTGRFVENLRHCLSVSDEWCTAVLSISEFYGSEDELLKRLVRGEIERTIDETTLFRGVSHATKTLSLFMNMRGRPFLESVVFPSIAPLLSSEIGALEIDPDRSDSTIDLQANATRLFEFVDHILTLIFSAADQCPSSFHRLFAMCKEEVTTKFPHMRQQIIAGLFFLRFVCPAMVTLQNVSRESRRNLVLVSKIIQNLANNVMFGEKESFLIPFNALLAKHQVNMTTFLETISTIPSNKNITMDLDRMLTEEELATHLDVLLLAMHTAEDKCLEVLCELDSTTPSTRSAEAVNNTSAHAENEDIQEEIPAFVPVFQAIMSSYRRACNLSGDKKTRSAEMKTIHHELKELYREQRQQRVRVRDDAEQQQISEPEARRRKVPLQRRISKGVMGKLITPRASASRSAAMAIPVQRALSSEHGTVSSSSSSAHHGSRDGETASVKEQQRPHTTANQKRTAEDHQEAPEEEEGTRRVGFSTPPPVNRRTLTARRRLVHSPANQQLRSAVSSPPVGGQARGSPSAHALLKGKSADSLLSSSLGKRSRDQQEDLASGATSSPRRGQDAENTDPRLVYGRSPLKRLNSRDCVIHPDPSSCAENNNSPMRRRSVRLVHIAAHNSSSPSLRLL